MGVEELIILADLSGEVENTMENLGISPGYHADIIDIMLKMEPSVG